jgi:hypothetical protein
VGVGVDVAPDCPGVAVAPDVGEAPAVAVAAPPGVAVAAPVGVAVAPPDGAPVGVAVGVAVAVAVGTAVGRPVTQPADPTEFVSIVTAPLRASARPATDAPVFRVMLVRARMLPTRWLVVPRVAELPTCQKTLQSEPVPALVTLTDALDAVVSVLAIWKTKTALELP